MATLTWTAAARNGNWDDPLDWSISGQPAGPTPGSGAGIWEESSPIDFSPKYSQPPKIYSD